MAGPRDSQVGISIESTYGTPVTPATFYEWDMGRSTHAWNRNDIAGSGVRPGGSETFRADRIAPGVGVGSLTLGLDAQTRAMGKLFRLAMGTSTSTLVGGTTYQQLHTTALAGGLLPSATIQYGIVRSDAAGTTDPHTYAGCTCTGFDLTNSANGKAEATFNFDGAAIATATALATAAYPTMGVPFNFRMASLTIGGTVVVPTPTALADTSGATAATNVRDATLSVNNSPNLARWRFAGASGLGRQQPNLASEREFTISATVDYTDTVVRDALIAATITPTPVTLTWADPGQPLSTGVATLQVVAPACIITGDQLAAPNADPTFSVTLRAGMPASGGPALYVVQRTADAAL